MTEIATIDQESSALEVLPAAQPPSLAARHMLQAHAEMMQTAFELAQGMCRTDLVPRRFKGKAQDGAAAILYGAELGLNPIQSLQRVIPIHGMPSLEARTMVALLKSRGYKVKTLAQSAESVTVVGIDLDGDEYESTWDITRARKAQYVPTPAGADSLCRPEVDSDWLTVTKTYDGKSKTSVLGNMKYITDPQAMLKAKAQAEVCRDMAPDVLLGISYTTEELTSERFDAAPAEAPSRPTAEPITVEEILDPTPAPAPAEANPDPTPDDAGDQAPAAEPVDAEVVEPAAEPALDQRKVRRLFALLKTVAVTDRDDRLVIFRHLTKRPEISSTNDLTPAELDRIIDALDKADKAGTLDDNVREVLNTAELEAENARMAAAAETAPDGAAQ
ncbi:MAG TPA: hypothetical protein VGG84_10365 [Gemmatimonadaceae bacterium]